MKKYLITLIAVFLGLCLWGAEVAGPAGVGGDPLAQIDALYERAMSLNYSSEGFAIMKESLGRCEKLLETNPSSFELLWRSARSALELGETAKIIKNQDWKDFCGFLAQKSVAWTDAAKLAEPGRVEGYFWQMKAMGLIYETKGALSFIAQGFVPGSRKAMDACCAIDPSYMDYTPILARALYLFTAPPLFGRNVAAALADYEVFAAKTHWSFEPYRQYTEAAQLLMSVKSKNHAGSARSLLLTALADPTPRPFYHELAASLLAKLEKM